MRAPPWQAAAQKRSCGSWRVPDHMISLAAAPLPNCGPYYDRSAPTIAIDPLSGKESSAQRTQEVRCHKRKRLFPKTVPRRVKAPDRNAHHEGQRNRDADAHKLVRIRIADHRVSRTVDEIEDR